MNATMNASEELKTAIVAALKAKLSETGDDVATEDWMIDISDDHTRTAADKLDALGVKADASELDAYRNMVGAPQAFGRLVNDCWQRVLDDAGL